jgi:hypothetical protein
MRALTALEVRHACVITTRPRRPAAPSLHELSRPGVQNVAAPALWSPSLRDGKRPERLVMTHNG